MQLLQLRPGALGPPPLLLGLRAGLGVLRRDGCTLRGEPLEVRPEVGGFLRALCARVLQRGACGDQGLRLIRVATSGFGLFESVWFG